MKKLTLFCLIAVIFLSGCSSTSTSNTSNEKKIQQSSSTSSTQFLMGGKIATNEQADIASKISARVSEISVDLGSKVKEGDVIIKLDTTDLQGQVDQAKAAVDTANANLANAQNSTRPEQMAQAQASVDSASENYNTVKKNYDRVQALVAAGAETQQNLDSLNQQLSAAQAQYKTAQEQLELLKNGPTESSINVYKAQVNQSEAALKTAQTALSNAAITSPISGVVNMKKINVGDTVTPGTALLSIINSSNLYINAYAPFEIVAQLREGEEVVVRVSDLPDKEFRGKISVINSNLDSETRDTLVKVALVDSDSRLKPGMFAEIGLKKQ
ncbi:HlyD family secretion protein [Clostridium luticellarii]|jgi:multidrug resistance efflux pump|uniref:Putative multidrug resistance protein EmrK n=1 Tax=Clostridium luticellarii TaxID=1691940 RepID=A0A2T0BSH9_9CLOT|nr:efflux RND transporter periplasmic adaptor subunit [Clostridium luticellarii]PRR86858.1 putative multidrug resistance protein EmrK [Clostridium luticellarii]